MFSWRKKTVDVQLAGRRLVLDPLPFELVAPLKIVLSRIIVGVNPPVPPDWYQNLSEALKYVYVAALEHDPKLDLSNFGRPTAEEAAAAIAALWTLTHKKSFWRHK